MIERADPALFALLWIEVEKGGFWFRHHAGFPAPATSGVFPEGFDLGTEPLQPFVSKGRWLVECPSPICGGMQRARPDVDRFFCIECLNRGTWSFLRVGWYDAAAIEAIEAALSARPDPLTRNWRPGETVGVLLFENHDHGLVDHENERVAGDVGYDQQRAIGRAQVPFLAPVRELSP